MDFMNSKMARMEQKKTHCFFLVPNPQPNHDDEGVDPTTSEKQGI